MKRLTVEKIILTLLLTACWLWMPVAGYESNVYEDVDVFSHATYIISHVNIWHLAGNLFVLWLLRRKLWLVPSVVMAVLCSFLPVFGIWPIGMTVGFSGVLFAIIGIKYGVLCRSGMPVKEFCRKALPFAVVGIVIPHINWCLHLYCLLAGFVYGRYNRD